MDQTVAAHPVSASLDTLVEHLLVHVVCREDAKLTVLRAPSELPPATPPPATPPPAIRSPGLSFEELCVRYRDASGRRYRFNIAGSALPPLTPAHAAVKGGNADLAPESLIGKAAPATELTLANAATATEGNVEGLMDEASLASAPRVSGSLTDSLGLEIEIDTEPATCTVVREMYWEGGSLHWEGGSLQVQGDALGLLEQLCRLCEVAAVEWTTHDKVGCLEELRKEALQNVTYRVEANCGCYAMTILLFFKINQSLNPTIRSIQMILFSYFVRMDIN